MKRHSPWTIALLLAAACTKSETTDASKEIEALEKRIDKLEAAQKKNEEVAAFVGPIMEQQKAEQEQQEAQMPDPAARFAVDIAGNPSNGPTGAPVTIVEAFDFA